MENDRTRAIWAAAMKRIRDRNNAARKAGDETSLQRNQRKAENRNDRIRATQDSITAANDGFSNTIKSLEERSYNKKTCICYLCKYGREYCAYQQSPDQKVCPAYRLDPDLEA